EAKTQTFEVRADQALLYRLSGDFNPLHVDPALATKVGFESPILHGLCSWGMALRAAITQVADGDPARIKSFSARFSGVVYPGDTMDVRIVPATEDGVFVLDAVVGDRSVLAKGVIHVG
ncbi:MAG: acyl dehydratase, partial [Bradymonadia bacterium]